MGQYDEAFYAGQRDTSRGSAEILLPYILELTGARSVADVGCGVAGWLEVAKEHGVTEVLGIDGDYVDTDWLRVDADEFVPHDLAEPIRVDRRFDLAMSMEVAEHLPPARAESFVADLCSLAPVVFFTAAQPHQLGTGHINLQYLDYWTGLFEARGYELIDCIRPNFWERDVAYYYAQNGAIFAKPGFVPDEARGSRMPLRAVHPELVNSVLLPPNALRPWLKQGREMVVVLPAAARTTYRNHRDEIPGLSKLRRG